MSEREILFLLFLGIYLSDCVAWFRRHSIVFRSVYHKAFALILPGALYGNKHGSLAFGNPFPPLGTLLVSSFPPMTMAPHGILLQSPDTTDCTTSPPTIFDYSNPKNLKIDDIALWITKDQCIKLESKCQAKEWFSLLTDLSSSNKNLRALRLEKFFKDSLNSETARERWNLFLKETGELRFHTNALVLTVFLFLPVGVWRWGLSAILIPWGMIFIFLLSATIWLFWQAHKTLYPEDRSTRRLESIKMLLCPPIAMRAHDLLSRDLLGNWHPITQASFLCTNITYRAFAERLLRHHRHPIRHGLTSSQQEIENWHRSTWAPLFDEFLKSTGLNPQELLAPPTPMESSCKSYCPRCLEQYVETLDACPDCFEISLKPLPPSNRKQEGI